MSFGISRKNCIYHISGVNVSGKFHGQIYSYPEKRWKKKKHYFLFSEEKMAKPSDIETGEAG